MNRSRLLLPVGLVLLVGVLAWEFVGADEPCADIDELLSHAPSGFIDLIGDEPVSDSGDDVRLVNHLLDGAEECSVTADAAATLYLCTWEHRLGSSDARARYQAEVDRVRSCAGGVAERRDESVNHPDSWESVGFLYDAAEVRVSIKNKGAQGLALVTLGVRA